VGGDVDAILYDGWMDVGRYVVFRTMKTKKNEQMIKSRGE